MQLFTRKTNKHIFVQQQRAVLQQKNTMLVVPYKILFKILRYKDKNKTEKADKLWRIIERKRYESVIRNATIK